MTYLNELAKTIAIINTENGWYESERAFGDDISLIHSEVSEAYEEYRNGYDPNTTYYLKAGKPEGIPSELADVIIRVLDTCYRYEIDIDSIIETKLAYNQKRGYRHGAKRV